MNVRCCTKKNPPVDHLKEIISFRNLLLSVFKTDFPGVSWRCLFYNLINLVNKYYNKMLFNVISPPIRTYPSFEEYGINVMDCIKDVPREKIWISRIWHVNTFIAYKLYECFSVLLLTYKNYLRLSLAPNPHLRVALLPRGVLLLLLCFLDDGAISSSDLYGMF